MKVPEERVSKLSNVALLVNGRGAASPAGGSKSEADNDNNTPSRLGMIADVVDISSDRNSAANSPICYEAHVLPKKELIEFSEFKSDNRFVKRLINRLKRVKDNEAGILKVGRFFVDEINSDEKKVLSAKDVISLIYESDLHEKIKQNLATLLVTTALRSAKEFTPQIITKLSSIYKTGNGFIQKRITEIFHILPDIDLLPDMIDTSIDCLKEANNNLLNPKFKENWNYTQKQEYENRKRIILNSIFDYSHAKQIKNDQIENIVPLLEGFCSDIFLPPESSKNVWSLNLKNLDNLFTKNFDSFVAEAERICKNYTKHDPTFTSFLVNKLPTCNEKQDEIILNFIHFGLDSQKITGFLRDDQLKLKRISEDNSNSHLIRQLAKKVFQKAHSAFPCELPKTNKISAKPILTKEVDSGLTVTELKAQLQKLNPGNPIISKFISGIDARLDSIQKAAAEDSKLAPQDKPISEYDTEDLIEWGRAVRADKNGRKLFADNHEHVAEVMAAISRAVELTRGYLPRDIQLMSVLMLLDSTETGKGRLLQIQTGEGKSTITAMMAAAKVLLDNKKVDIVTSSSVLAQRDAEEQHELLSKLNITCDHNCIKQYTGLKKCYISDVVYGDALSFQSDLLRTEFKGDGLRGDRDYQFVIVDEVDSMLVDEAGKIAKLAAPICGMEHVENIFICIAMYIKNSVDITPETLAKDVDFEKFETRIKALIEQICSPASQAMVVPAFLKEFVYAQSSTWARSALEAIRMQENINYVKAKDDRGREIIAPVDHASTGVVQINTSWSRGLHQFLQIKHHLRITPESLTTSFISNMTYFQKYGANLCGMTGTLGSTHAKDLLKHVYEIDTATIPTFKAKQFEQEPGFIASSPEDHKIAICKTAILEAKKGRSVLVICRNIAEGLELASQLENNYNNAKVKKYLRSDESGAADNNFDGKSESGDVIVATNLAGRGTDISTTEEIEKAGGMHVIITFMPSNLRVEEQAFGRTSRQGKKGSGELIIDGPRTAADFKTKELSFDSIYKIRDEQEMVHLSSVKEDKVKEMRFKDDLFKSFQDQVYHHCKVKYCKGKENNISKLQQLEDDWGFWLKRQEQKHPRMINEEVQSEVSKEFEIFKKEKISEYNNGIEIFSNPGYLAQYIKSNFSGDRTYSKSCELLADPQKVDPNFSYQLHYLRALARLGNSASFEKQNENYTKERAKNTDIAVISLQKAKMQIDGVVMQQVQSAILQLGPEATDTELYKQLDNKMRLYDTASRNIQENLDFIAANDKRGKNTIKFSDDLQSYRDLFGSEIDKDDIEQFASFGISFIFHADAQAYTKDHLSGTFVAIVGVAQVFAGAVLAIGSAGFAANFGISLAAGGFGDIVDGIKAASKGEAIDLGEWAKGKGIEIGISLMMAAIPGPKGADAAKNAGKEASKQAGKKAVEKLTAQQFAEAFVKQIATTQLTKIGINYAVEKIANSAANPINAEIKRLAAAVRNSFHSNPTYDRMREICQADEVQYALTRQEAVYQKELEQEILSVIDRKSDEFASIAQNVITSAAEKAASGNSFASTAVTVVSTGASVAKGVSEISALKSYLLSGIHEKSARVAANLPGLEGLLESSIHGINGSKAHIVRTVLESRGVISGSGNVTHLQVDLDKFGFVPGLSVSRRSEELQEANHPGHSNCHPGLDPGSQAAGSHATSTNVTNRSVVRAGEQGIAITPFVFEELNQASQRTTSVSEESPIRDREAGTNTTEFGEAEKHRGQIYEVLSKVDAVNRADHNYDAQIDHMASHISEIVGDRMRGMVCSGIIRPITAPIVQQAASTMVDWTANWIESYANKTSTKMDGLSAADGSGEIISGVAAGDGYASPDEYSYDDEAEEAQEQEVEANNRLRNKRAAEFWQDKNLGMAFPYYDEKQLNDIKADLGSASGFIQNEIDNFKDKAHLTKENVSWAKENPVDAAIACAVWAYENPTEAADLGITVASIFPQVRTLKALRTYQAQRRIVSFNPKEGFKTGRIIEGEFTEVATSNTKAPGKVAPKAPKNELPTSAAELDKYIKAGKPGYKTNVTKAQKTSVDAGKVDNAKLGNDYRAKGQQEALPLNSAELRQKIRDRGLPKKIVGLGEGGVSSKQTPTILSDSSANPTPTQQRINETTGVSKTGLPKKQKEFLVDLKELSNWPKLQQYVDRIHKQLGAPGYTKKGAGLKWEIKEGNQINTIRIDKAQPGHRHPTQCIDHVAISYNNRVVDKTGLNYILKDDSSGAVYKVSRSIADKRKVTIKDGFDITTDYSAPAKHVDAHIPASAWQKWREIWKP